MRAFVTVATGAIGRQLVPGVVEAGHEIHGMTHTESKQAMLQELDAVPVVADALNTDQVAKAVGSERASHIERAIEESSVAGFRTAMLVCAWLAVGGALAAALLIRDTEVWYANADPRPPG